jgi:hypothetical protein
VKEGTRKDNQKDFPGTDIGLILFPHPFSTVQILSVLEHPSPILSISGFSEIKFLIK